MDNLALFVVDESAFESKLEIAVDLGVIWGKAKESIVSLSCLLFTLLRSV